jgi:hypothetical protein
MMPVLNASVVTGSNPPRHIIASAMAVTDWCKQNGHSDWVLDGVTMRPLSEVKAAAVPPPEDLNLSSEYRVQIALLEAAVAGLWKEGLPVPEQFDTPLLHKAAAMFARVKELERDLAKALESKPTAADWLEEANEAAVAAGFHGLTPAEVIRLLHDSKEELRDVQRAALGGGSEELIGDRGILEIALREIRRMPDTRTPQDEVITVVRAVLADVLEPLGMEEAI